jgi:hypothetical protein
MFKRVLVLDAASASTCKTLQIGPPKVRHQAVTANDVEYSWCQKPARLPAAQFLDSVIQP